MHCHCHTNSQICHNLQLWYDIYRLINPQTEISSVCGNEPVMLHLVVNEYFLMTEWHAAARRYLLSHYRCVTLSLGGAVAVMTFVIARRYKGSALLGQHGKEQQTSGAIQQVELLSKLFFISRGINLFDFFIMILFFAKHLKLAQVLGVLELRQWQNEWNPIYMS